jgi:outer membrane lipoprotein-sorting protein
MKKLFLILTCIVYLTATAQDSKEKIILNKMLAACQSLKSAKQVFKSTERMDDGKYYDSEMIIKFEAYPKKVYIYCINPNAGAECLWVEGKNNNKVIVNPNGFPYFTLRLSPYNELLRQDTHHTIKEIGFDYVMAMLKHYTISYGDNFYGFLTIVDTLTWDNHSCIHLRFDYKDYKCNPYTVKVGETITSISEKNYLNDYMVLRCNPGLKNYDSCKPGQVIQLPNFYNRKVEFYVDRTTWLPLVQMVYDDKGLFEKYELQSFISNPVFDPSEFTTSYKSYGF